MKMLLKTGTTGPAAEKKTTTKCVLRRLAVNAPIRRMGQSNDGILSVWPIACKQALYADWLDN